MMSVLATEGLTLRSIGRQRPTELPRVDLARHAGRCGRERLDLTAEAKEDSTARRFHYADPIAQALGTEPTQEFLPLDRNLFVTRSAQDAPWTPVAFFSLSHGSCYPT